MPDRVENENADERIKLMYAKRELRRIVNIAVYVKILLFMESCKRTFRKEHERRFAEGQLIGHSAD